MNLVMKLIRMNLGMRLIFCMWLGIHKYIYLIQSIHVSVWSGTPWPSNSNSQYQICNMPRLNWAMMLIFCKWVGFNRNKKIHTVISSGFNVGSIGIWLVGRGDIPTNCRGDFQNFSGGLNVFCLWQTFIVMNCKFL